MGQITKKWASVSSGRIIKSKVKEFWFCRLLNGAGSQPQVEGEKIQKFHKKGYNFWLIHILKSSEYQEAENRHHKTELHRHTTPLLDTKMGNF